MTRLTSGRGADRWGGKARKQGKGQRTNRRVLLRQQHGKMKMAGDWDGKSSGSPLLRFDVVFGLSDD